MKLSIITPSYNQGQYLEQTILSVLEQNYADTEYIIIDGGSTDESVEIIKKYQKYLTYWESTPDQGQYHAIQKGFDRSTGDIMAWLNSDDMYHKGCFSIVTEIFSKFPHVQWLTGFPTIYDEKGRTVEVNENRHYSYYDFLAIENEGYIQQESTFWRRELWQQAGACLNQQWNFAGDFELWLRFYACQDLYAVDALLGGFRFRSSNQKSVENSKNYEQEMRQIVKQATQNLTEKHRMQFDQRQRYRHLKQRKWLNNLFNFEQKFKELAAYPPKIAFDVKKQDWCLKNIEYLFE